MRTALLCLLLAGTAHASEPLRAMFVFPALATATQFQPYASSHFLSEVRNAIFMNSLAPADHERFSRRLAEEFVELAEDGKSVLFAFSIGAKFAARVAAEERSVAGLFLVDPVDGGMPLPWIGQTVDPFFPDETPRVFVPTVIIQSEAASTPGGTLCVPRGMGGAHFERIIAPGLVMRETAAGAGHLDFLAGPAPLAQLLGRLVGCAHGPRPARETIRLTRERWEAFLAMVSGP